MQVRYVRLDGLICQIHPLVSMSAMSYLSKVSTVAFVLWDVRLKCSRAFLTGKTVLCLFLLYLPEHQVTVVITG